MTSQKATPFDKKRSISIMTCSSNIVIEKTISPNKNEPRNSLTIYLSSIFIISNADYTIIGVTNKAGRHTAFYTSASEKSK